MTRLALAALLFAATSASAFFRPPTTALEFLEAANPLDRTVFCAVQLRYNSNEPTNLELSFRGKLACLSGQEAAMTAAASTTKQDGTLAWTPVYQCAVLVSWTPAKEATPEVVATGTGCDSTRAIAMAAAVRAVACMHRGVRCRP